MSRALGLKRLLQPRHLAVFGGGEAAEVIRQCDRSGFRGDIWPLHPSRDSIEGRLCFRSVRELPLAPDASFVAIPGRATIDVVRQLAECGAGGVVCYASGFAEAGEAGVDLQRRLVAAAGDMALVGPNCYGILSYLDGVALWPDQHGGERCDSGVAILTQSGNIGLSLTMQRRSLPLAYLISVGNQAVLEMHDYIDVLIEDARVSAIGLHIEGLSDIAAFSAAAVRALQKAVPIVALKAGSSEAGARTAISHTRALSSSDTLYDALFARVGIARVDTLPQLLETLKLLSVIGPLPAASIASISCSGGEAALVADLAERLQLTLPPLHDGQIGALRATLGDQVALANPLDYHTYIWNQFERQRDCFGAVLQGEQALTLKVLDLPREDRCQLSAWDTTIDAFIAAVGQSGGKAAIASSLPENMPEATANRLSLSGIAPMQGLQECLVAVKAAALIGQRQNESADAQPVAVASARSEPSTTRLLSEWDSKQVLKGLGVAVPEGRFVSAQAAPEAAIELGFPVVVKALAPGVAHKTETGGVILNCRNGEDVAAAIEQMSGLAEQFIVEKMVTDTVAEMIVGASRDRLFGLTLTIGSGGVLTELLGDSVQLLLPVDVNAIHKALRSLKVYPLIEGYRGCEPGDVIALIRAIGIVAAYLNTVSAGLIDLDINPLLVRPAGRGVVAADALIHTFDNRARDIA